MSRSELARRQAALVAALVGEGPAPDGFDPARLRATTEALLHKRAGEVAAQWPALRAELGPQWTEAFREWARGRPPQGSLRDGWDFARTVALGPAGARELAARTARFVYDGAHPPRPRRLPAVRRVGRTVLVYVGGHLLTIGRPDHSGALQQP